MKTRLRVVRFVLVVLFLLVVMVYVWLALAPTGYGRLEKDDSKWTQAAARLIERQEAGSDKTPSNEQESTGERPTSATLGAAPPRIRAENAKSSGTNTICEDLHACLEDALVSRTITRDRLQIPLETFCRLDPEDVDSSVTAEAVAKPALAEKIRQKAREHLVAMYLTHDIYEVPDEGSETYRYLMDPAAEASWRSLESLLLAPDWRIPRFEDAFNHLRAWGESEAFMLAAYRLFVKGERERGEQLLARSLEMERVLHESYLDHRPVSYPQLYLFEFARRGWLSPEGLRRIQQVLQRSRVSDAQLADLRAADALRWMRTRKEKPLFAPRENPWHAFLGGVPERMVTRVLEPLEAGMEEKYIMAYVRGDMQAMASTQIPMGLLHAAANSRGMETDGPVFVDTSTGNTDAMAFNAPDDFTHFIVAAARFKRERGKYPESTRELVPQYLPPAFLQMPRTQWLILRLKPFRCLNLATKKDRVRFDKYIYLYMPRHKKWPEAAEDLREYLPNQALYSDLKSHEQTTPEMLLFCRISHFSYPRPLQRPYEGVNATIKILSLSGRYREKEKANSETANSKQ